ncbi:MAG: hypothetical protein ACI4P4_07065, partial [Faecousia sp.]
SCIPQKGIEGSNPSFSAKDNRNLNQSCGYFLFTQEEKDGAFFPLKGSNSTGKARLVGCRGYQTIAFFRFMIRKGKSHESNGK